MMHEEFSRRSDKTNSLSQKFGVGHRVSRRYSRAGTVRHGGHAVAAGIRDTGAMTGTMTVGWDTDLGTSGRARQTSEA